MVINLVLAKLNSCYQPFEAIMKREELKEKKIKRRKKKKVEELGQDCSSKCKITVTQADELSTHRRPKGHTPVPAEGERGNAES